MPCSACGGAKVKHRGSGGRKIGLNLGIRGCASYYKYKSTTKTNKSS